MSESTRLWPDPEYMHKYLDNWRMYIESLENQVLQISNMHATERSEAALTISELRQKLETAEQPLLQEIEMLRTQLRQVESQVHGMEAERREAIDRLAENLEIKVTQGLTLKMAVSQTSLLINESKKMVQENL